MEIVSVDGELSRSALGGETILGPDNTDRGMWREKTIICQSTKWTRARYRGFLLERSIACSLTGKEISVGAKSKRIPQIPASRRKISFEGGWIFLINLCFITYKTTCKRNIYFSIIRATILGIFLYSVYRFDSSSFIESIRFTSDAILQLVYIELGN